MRVGVEDFPPTADMRPVDEAAAWVAFNKELEFECRDRSSEEKAREIRRELEISALVWLSRRYGSSEYDLQAMISEIGEWRDWQLDEGEAESMREFGAHTIQRDDHEPARVETTVYLHMTKDC